MGKANKAQHKTLKRVMKYGVDTPEGGMFLNPTGVWDGKDQNFEFQVRGISDLEYMKDKESRHSVGGHVVYLNDDPVSTCCKMQQIVCALVTEAELIQAVECAHDMLFVYRLLSNMGLKVALPMILEMDNQGAIDIINNWSSTGQTRHIDARLKRLRE